MARYRLRFHLQEVDLQRGITLLGRSEDCEVTIEDPLVSRRHARIVIDGEDVVLEDLSSRNGVRVNGKPIRGPTKLIDSDRVRIGTQEFVFCRLELEPSRRAKTTGVLRLCAKCKLPYPRESVSCPNCGGTEQTDESTLSGAGVTSQHSWSMQLLTEALEKALSMSREADAERILRRATTLLEERIASGGAVDAGQVLVLARVAARLAVLLNDSTWASWIASFYSRARLFPPANITDELGRLAVRFADLNDHLGPFIARARTLRDKPAPEDFEALSRLARRIGSDETGPIDLEATTAVPPKV